MFSRARGLESGVARRRRRRRAKVRLIISVVLAVVLIGGALVISRLDAIRIERVYPSGTILLKEEEVMAIAREAIAGSYLYIFPKNNIFIYPRTDIKNTLLRSYPELSDVSVSFRDFKSISINISERKSQALWCLGDYLGALSESKCYLSDEHGLVFRDASGLENGSLIRFFGGIEGEPIKKTILPAEEFLTTLAFVERLKQAGLSVVVISLEEGGVRKGGLLSGGDIIWNANEDLENALKNLELLLASSGFKGRDKSGNLSVSYIDIQNVNKIFYKAK